MPAHVKELVPAREGRAFDVPAGHRIRITTPQGPQAADFWAFSADNHAEYLSARNTWALTRSVRPREGETFLGSYPARRPMLYFEEDRAGGVHDMLLAACDSARYRQLGVAGEHPSCSENLMHAMAARGLRLDDVPQPVNFFTFTEVQADQTFEAPPNPVEAGSYVVLRALVDLVCVVSACPYDLTIWKINGPGPTDLCVEVEAQLGTTG